MSASSRKVSVWLLVVLLPTAVYIGWSNYQRIRNADAEESETTPPKLDTSRWGVASEEGWLVDETARDISELLAFAKSPVATV